MSDSYEKIVVSIITILVVLIVGGIPFMTSEFQKYVGFGGMLKHSTAITVLLICSAIAGCIVYSFVQEVVDFGFGELFDPDNFIFYLILGVYFFVVAGISGTVTTDEIQAKRQSTFRPMLEQFAQHSGLSKSLDRESVQRMDGTILILFVREGKVSFYEDCFCDYDLPKEFQAEDPNDIDYVVYPRYVGTIEGFYGGSKRSTGKRVDIEAIIIDWHTKKIIASNNFRGGSPPNTTSFPGGKTGRIPHKEFCQWLKSLLLDEQMPTLHPLVTP